MPRSLSSSLVASFQFVGLAQVHDIAHGHIEFQSPTLKHDYFCVFFIYQSTNSQNWINAFSAQAQRPRLRPGIVVKVTPRQPKNVIWANKPR